ncbi:hypothetical protein D3C75_491490 [compost metagenome]
MGQPGYPIALDSHANQQHRHIGLIAAFQRGDFRCVANDDVCHFPQECRGRVRQVRNRLLACAKPEHRLALRVGRTHGDECIMAERQATEALRVQGDGGERMMVDNHQVAAAFFEGDDGVIDVGRHYPGIEALVLLLELAEPFRQERHGQAVGCRDLDRAPWHPFHVPQVGAQCHQGGERLAGFSAEGLAGGRELYRVGGTINQFDTHPLFERADSPGKRGLCNASHLGGARKILPLGDRHEVVQPLDLHR